MSPQSRLNTSSQESQNFDLVVVSAYGRGNWMATELASRGWKVAMVDVTSTMRQAPWEDVEGPFGLLESHDVLPSQRARLADEGELVPVPGGFTMWLPEGPLEFRSELAPFLMRARNVPSEVESYLRRSGVKSRESERERKALSRLMYGRTWLAHFAHVFASNVHSENHSGLRTGSATPLFSSFAVRQATASGQAKGLKQVQASGVTVLNNAKVRDVRLSNKTVDAIEIEHEKGHGVERARAFVWCLSFEETKGISAEIASKLYPSGGPEATWAWERFRFDFEIPQAISSALPMWSVVIDDVDLAWTRANMMVLRRWPQAQALDVWLKIPSWMRTETGALASVLDDVTKSLARRLPEAKLSRQIADPSATETRPILWPVFESSQAQFVPPLASRRSSNFFFHAPDLWPALDWIGRFRFENGVVERLEDMKSKWDEAARKLAERSAKA